MKQYCEILFFIHNNKDIYPSIYVFDSMEKELRNYDKISKQTINTFILFHRNMQSNKNLLLYTHSKNHSINNSFTPYSIY